MRFQELRDEDGTVLARGLHPAIAVVAANPAARALVTSGARGKPGCLLVREPEVQGETRRAEELAKKEHEEALVDKRAKVEEAERVLREATDAVVETSRASAIAMANLSRFDDLATTLSTAQESYEAAVRADAEAARSLAAALAELDRTLGQRHIAGTSLEQARKARENGAVPDAVLNQALNLQMALANAEAERYAAVQQADEISKAARAATTDALQGVGAAHDALTAGLAMIGAAPPSWGHGVPLPGLVGNYRDQLAAARASASAAEDEAKRAETAAQARLEQERRDLASLNAIGIPLLRPQDTIARWVSSDHFETGTAVFVDDAFHGFGQEGAASLITTLAGRGCQVIYLTEDPELLGWAINLPHEVGGASTIASSRALASVTN